MSCDFLGGEKRVQEAVHKAPLPSGTERQVEKDIEVNSASDAKVGLAHLEEVRGKLQNRSGNVNNSICSLSGPLSSDGPSFMTNCVNHSLYFLKDAASSR